MTRIVYWNLKQFSGNKIASGSGGRVKGRGGMPENTASFFRRWGILNVINALNPDILVVGEVTSGHRGPGQLVSDSQGRRGCLLLAQRLRAWDALADWRLVPPLQVGTGRRTEGVAIFYKGLTAAGGGRFFTGPYRWSGGGAGAAMAPPAVGVDYPPLIREALVGPSGGPAPLPSRNVPNLAQHNGGQPEAMLAASVTLHEAATGNVYDFGNLRQPYFCTFCETDAMGAVSRNLSLFAVHSPPDAVLAPAFLTILGDSAEVSGALGGNEVRVVLGDFNVNLLDAQAAYANVYANLINYAPLLLPTAAAPAAGPFRQSFRGFFTTHIKPKPVLWQQGAAALSYPGYAYMGSARVASFYSIDNILVRRGLGPAPASQVTIANTVTGVPYANPPGPAYPVMAAPPGTVPVNHQFIGYAGPWPARPDAPAFQRGLPNALMAWRNYGHVYGVSDHFAVFANV
jgi:hypothetical protein